MIDLYTSRTPNGAKVSIALEELGLPYRVIPLRLWAGDQKRPEYVALNPNARIPTIVDHDEDDFVVFESGAILVYLAEKTGLLLPKDFKGRSRVMQWLMFQMGGVGPMMGQANVFFRYMEEKIPAAIDRYHREVKRLFGVLDRRLDGRQWLCDEYSIADIANFAWVRTHRWSGVDIEEGTPLHAWVQRMYDRPAVLRGIDVPSKDSMAEGDSDGDFVVAARKMLV